MVKEAKGFNISKENYTWSKEKSKRRRLVRARPPEPEREPEPFSGWISTASLPPGSRSGPLNFWSDKETKIPNDHKNTNQSLYFKKYTHILQLSPLAPQLLITNRES